MPGLPDLWAKGLNIVADYGTSLLYVSAVVENIGPGAASGPFTIQTGVTIENGGTTTYFENFVVPADVTISGTPIMALMAVQPQGESHVVRLPTTGGTMQTTYVTAPLEVPLEFFDVNSATYTAGFYVDLYGQVDDYNRANNQYTWPGSFTFLSPQAQQQEGQVVVRRAG